MNNKLETDKHLSYIAKLRDKGCTWDEVAERFNDAYDLGVNKTANAIRKFYDRYKDIEFDESAYIDNLKKTHTAKKAKTKIARENRVLLDYVTTTEGLEEGLKELLKGTKFAKLKLPKPPKKSKKKKNMTMEVMFSDVHYGKKTDEFNLEICRNRVQQLAEASIQQVALQQANYNLNEIVLFLGGDIIESYTFHGLESAKGCEFGNSVQVQESINSMFFDLILPLASTGIDIFVPCVTGNHDRTESHKTFVTPGRDNVTWIIYNMLSLLCKQTGLKNVRFEIAENPYIIYKIFGDIVLYEHGDLCKANTKVGLEKHVANRSVQVGSVINYFRMGHYHENSTFDKGKIITNGAVCGQDGYAEAHGFNTRPCQVINFYVETKSRPESFYYSFPVHLD